MGTDVTLRSEITSRMACAVGATQASYPSLMANDLYVSEVILSPPPSTSSSSSSSSAWNLRLSNCASTSRISSGASTSANGVLKRKRPPRIEIPGISVVAESDPGVEEMELDSMRFSVFCKRGRTRKEMEDRYKASLDIDRNPNLAFFGIYDGHGGAVAADFSAENLDKNVMAELEKRKEEQRAGYESAIRTGYLKTDEDFSAKQGSGGTCCVTAVIKNGDLIVSNAGDCRAVISRSGDAEALTSDHRPCREDERSRIEKLGGFLDYCGGALRLQGTLAVSRGIGDRHLKPWMIAEPETTILKLAPDHEFLILASDGLWDNVSNQEAVDIARPACLDSVEGSKLSACKQLADLSISRGTKDDVSVMIVKLREFAVNYSV